MNNIVITKEMVDYVEKCKKDGFIYKDLSFYEGDIWELEDVGSANCIICNPRMDSHCIIPTRFFPNEVIKPILLKEKMKKHAKEVYDKMSKVDYGTYRVETARMIMLQLIEASLHKPRLNIKSISEYAVKQTDALINELRKDLDKNE